MYVPVAGFLVTSFLLHRALSPATVQMSTSPALLIVLELLLVAVLYAASISLSIRIMKNKEF